MTNIHEVPLSDKELSKIQEFADAAKLTIDQAATQLFANALADRVFKKTRRLPAKVYAMPVRAGK